ncbi:MAG: hypothetical protein HQ508_06050 [Candidatus Marinimicrobia bacterium]|nr:hypothetical protein [Candidatus Neomarinimicrobiota bacterium]
MRNFKKNPIPMLLKAAPLPIRYQLLVDVLEDSSSEDFLALQKNLRKHQARRKLLADQQPDGLWALGGKTSGLSEHQLQMLQFLKQLEVLHELLDMSVTYKQEKIMLGMREVLRTLAEKDLPLRLHHLTQAIHLAIVYKLEGNPIIKRIVREILARQNADGGWSSLVHENETCIWSTQYFLWTLGQSENFKGNRSLKKGLKYLQSQLLQSGQSKLLPGMQAWDTLISGTSGLSVISGGTLRYLETLQIVDDSARERKTNKLLDWLIDAQLKDGLWPSIVNLDRQGEFSVTLRVLKVLKHFQTQRVQETLNYESEYE